MVLGIVRDGIGDEPLAGDLLEPDFARTRQWMRRMHGDTNGVTAKLFEDKPAQHLR